MTTMVGPDWRLEVGDALERLREEPAESVHCAITSPPYWGLRDYGVEGQLGLEETPEAWCVRLVEVFREVRRVLRRDGTLWANVGDGYARNPPGNARLDHSGGTLLGTRGRQNRSKAARVARRVATLSRSYKPKDLLGLPWTLAFALRADGWWLRRDVIWSKPNPIPESVTDRPTTAHEYVFLFSRSPRYYYDPEAIREPATWGNHPRSVLDDGRPPDARPPGSTPQHGLRRTAGPEAGRNKRSVWTIHTQPCPVEHAASFPEALVEPMILAGTSAKGACAACGAPWRRVREPDTGGTKGRDWNEKRDVDGGFVHAPSSASMIGYQRGRTVGWEPTCRCGSPERVPCVVLDPFAGTATSGVVANRHGRRFLGIELNPDYADAARRRLRGELVFPQPEPDLGQLLLWK